MSQKERKLICSVCNLPYDSLTQFEEHQWSMLHHRQLENKKKVKKHFCSLCKQQWSTLPEYGIHLIGEHHKTAARRWSQKLKKVPIAAHHETNSSRGWSSSGWQKKEAASPRNNVRSVKPLSEERPCKSYSTNLISPPGRRTNRYGERSFQSSYQHEPPFIQELMSTTKIQEPWSPFHWYPGNQKSSSDGPSHKSATVWTRSNSATSWGESNNQYVSNHATDNIVSGIQRGSPIDNSRNIPTFMDICSSSVTRSESFADNDFALQRMNMFEQNEMHLSQLPSGSNLDSNHLGRGHLLRDRSSLRIGSQKFVRDIVNSQLGTLPKQIGAMCKETKHDISHGLTCPPESSSQHSAKQSKPPTRHSEPSIRYNDTFTRLNEPSTRQNESSTKQKEPSPRQSEPSNKQNKFSTRQNKSSNRQKSFSRQNEPSAGLNEPSVRQNKPFARQNKPFSKQNEPTTKQKELSSRKNEPSARKSDPSARKNDPSGRRNDPCRQNVLSTKQNETSTRLNELSVRQNEPSAGQNVPLTKQNELPARQNTTRCNEPSSSENEISTSQTEPTRNDVAGETVAISPCHQPSPSSSTTSGELTISISHQNQFKRFVMMNDLSSEVVNTTLAPQKPGNSDNGIESHADEQVDSEQMSEEDGNNSKRERLGESLALGSEIDSPDERIDADKPVVTQRHCTGLMRQNEEYLKDLLSTSRRHAAEATKNLPVRKKADSNMDNRSMSTCKVNTTTKESPSLFTKDKDETGVGHKQQKQTDEQSVSNPFRVDQTPSDVRSPVSESTPVMTNSRLPVTNSEHSAGSRVETNQCSLKSSSVNELLALERSSVDFKETNMQLTRLSAKSTCSMTNEKVQNGSILGSNGSGLSEKPSTGSIDNVCETTTTNLNALQSTSSITLLERNKSPNRSSASNILPDLIKKHVEKLQRYRSSRPNLTSSRVQHHPSQHSDLALFNLKHILLHLFERPISSHRKKLQEAQLKKIFAKASKSSERFKRFGVHLETSDPDDDEMIKVLEKLTEEDLELLAKEDSKEDLQELLSLFEFAEDNSFGENVQNFCLPTKVTLDGGVLQQGGIGTGVGMGTNRKDADKINRAAPLMSDSESSDVELIETVPQDIVVSSETEDEDEAPVLLPPQKLSPGPDNSLHGQVFQLSLKENEFRQQLKALRKDQKALEKRIQQDTEKVDQLKKKKIEMKKKVKVLRKNRLNLTKAHSQLASQSINLSFEDGNSTLSSTDSPITVSSAEENITRPSLLAKKTLLVHDVGGYGSVMTPGQVLVAGNGPLIYQASSLQGPTIPPRNPEIPDITCSQPPNQLVGHFNIPPSAMGISIQRLTEEDVLMLARQEALTRAVTSQSPDSLTFVSGQTSSDAMISSHDRSEYRTQQLTQGLLSQGVAISCVRSLHQEGGPVSQTLALGGGTLSQTRNLVQPGNTNQPSLQEGINSQTANAVQLGISTQPSLNVGTISQTQTDVIQPQSGSESELQGSIVTPIMRVMSHSPSTGNTSGGVQHGLALEIKSSPTSVSGQEESISSKVSKRSRAGTVYPVSISKITPPPEKDSPDVVEGHQCMVIKTEIEAGDMIATEIAKKKSQGSGGEESTSSSSLPDLNIATRDSNGQIPEEHDSSSSLDFPADVRRGSRQTFATQYDCKRKRQSSRTQFPDGKRSNVVTVDQGLKNVAYTLSSKMLPKVVLKSCLSNSSVESSSPVTNSFSASSSPSSQREEGDSIRRHSLRLQDHRDGRSSQNTETPRSDKSPKRRIAAPAPNLKKSRVKPTRVKKKKKLPKCSDGSPFSYNNLQKHITEAENTQLGILTDHLISKHMRAVRKYKKLGLSEYYIQIARNGKLASRIEIRMLKQEVKRVTLLKKSLIPEITPLPVPAVKAVKTPSQLQDRRLRRHMASQQRREKKVELFKSFGMSPEYLNIMAKGQEATKEETASLNREINKNYMKQYMATKKDTHKAQRIVKKQMIRKLSATANKQLNDYILLSLKLDKGNPTVPNVVTAHQSGHQPEQQKEGCSQNIMKNHSQLADIHMAAAIIGLSVGDNKLYSFSVDGSIKFYNVKNLSCEGSYSGHMKRITGLHIQKDTEGPSMLLFTCSRDHHLQCRVIRNGDLTTIRNLDLGHPITCMTATAGSLFMGLANGHVNVLNGQSFKSCGSFSCHNKEIGSITIAEFNDEKFLVTGAYDAKLAIHSITTGELYCRLDGHKSSILCVKTAGKFIISGASDHKFLQHDFLTKKLVMKYTHHTRAITDINVHHSKIYTACLDDKVRVFDFQKMELVKIIDAENVLSLCYYKKHVYIGTTDGKVNKLSSLKSTIEEKKKEDS